MRLKNIRKLAKHYLSPNAKAKDKQRFESILDGLAERGKEPDLGMLSMSRKSVFDKILNARRRKVSNRNVFMVAGRYAASIMVVGLLAWAYFYIQTVRMEEPQLLVKETGVGMRSTITLSDGSLVRINENSRLEFPEIFEKDHRTVKLTGEAFFEIKPDQKRPFKVSSEESEVTVLGTSFNVNTLHATEITVATGKVKVADNRTKDLVFLKPGQQAILNKDKIQVLEVNPDFFIGWHTRKLHFENEPIENVFRILQRAYGVQIDLKEKSKEVDCLITGFYEGERIETILKGLTHIIAFHYETDISMKTIKIELNKCKK